MYFTTTRVIQNNTSFWKNLYISLSYTISLEENTSELLPHSLFAFRPLLKYTGVEESVRNTRDVPSVWKFRVFFSFVFLIQMFSKFWGMRKRKLRICMCVQEYSAAKGSGSLPFVLSLFQLCKDGWLVYRFDMNVMKCVCIEYFVQGKSFNCYWSKSFNRPSLLP